MPKRESSAVAASPGTNEPEAHVVRVGRLDSMISGSPVCVLVGPFPRATKEDFARRLHGFSDGRPANRVGLIPSRESTRWEFSRGFSSGAVLDGTPILGPFGDAAGPDIDGIVNRLIAVDIDAPIAVIPYGDYLVLRFDHGIGDAHILMCIVAALSGPDDIHDALTIGNEPQVASPVLRALINVIATQPRDFVRDCQLTARTVISVVLKGLGRRLHRAPPPLSLQEPVAESPADYCAVYVKSDVDYRLRLRAQRDSKNLDVTLPALTLWSVCRSLELAGIAVRPGVEVLVDLRKFLPPGQAMSGNFLAVSRMKYGSEVDLKSFGNTFSETISSTRPVLNLIGHICLDWVRSNVFRRGAPSDWSPAGGTSDGMATVTYSDITRLDEVKAVQWGDVDLPRDFAVALPPASRSHIAILVCAPREGQIALTASFFPSQFAPDAVRRALALAVAGSIDDQSADELLREAN